MRTYEFELRKFFQWVLNHLAQTIYYESWDDKFCRDENKKNYGDAIDFLKKYVDLKSLSRDDARYLGFGPWDDDLFLIPLYLVPLIPIGIELISINGEIIIYDGTNIDLDTRFGCIAYGIRIPENEEEGH